MTWHLEFEIYSAVIIGIIMVYYFRGPRVPTWQNRIYGATLVISMAFILTNIVATLLVEHLTPANLGLAVFFNNLYLIFLPSMPMMVLLYVISIIYQEFWHKRALVILAFSMYFVYLILALSNPLTHFYFTLDLENGYVRGAGNPFTHVSSISYILCAAVIAVYNRKKISKLVFTALCAFMVLSLAAIALVSKNSQTLYLEQHIRLGMFYPLIYMYARLYCLVEEKIPHIRPALVGYASIIVGLFADTMYLSGWATADMYMLYPVTLCLLLMCMIYIYYQRVIEIRQQEAIRIANLYKEMEQKSADMMVSQLQPHFMFNTLQAIQVLARRDTRLADKVIFTFSNYLRSNLDFVKINQPVPFDKALVPVQCYVDIEKIRFKNRFDAVYDIEATDFSVPPLCIQPLVENAVKHGVCRKPEGGTVTLSTREHPDHYEVVITDDGVGFDTEKLSEKKDGGIYNARFQLTHMLDAVLVIESVPGQGTVQRVKIPKKE